MAALDADWIWVFVEVYKTRNVSRAAEKLGLTQGTASTALARLRTYYDDPLFVRTARGMMPTPRAEALYPILREVHDKLQVARTGEPAFDPKSARRTFRVCMTDLGEIALLPRLINYLARHAPGI